jgi:hypothetical protein
MIFLIALVFVIGLGIYYVTNLDFTIGEGFRRRKKDTTIRDAEYIVLEDEDTEEKKTLSGD